MMPTYKVTDPNTGKTVKLTGDSPPTEQELDEIFASLGAKPVPPEAPAQLPQEEPPTDEYAEFPMERARPTPVSPMPIIRSAMPILEPVAEGVGLVAGGILGAPAGPAGMVAGAGLGYGAARQGIGLTKEWLGDKPPQPLPERMIEAGQDVAMGAAMEAGGQVLPVGLQMAGKAVSKVTEPVQKYLYESALKIPPSVPKQMRDVAVEAGIKGHYVPSPKGLSKLRSDIERVNKQIAEFIDMGAKSGKSVDTDLVLERLDVLRDFYKNAINPQDYLPLIDDIAKQFKAYRGDKIPLDVAQKIKQTTYALHRKHYGELKTLSVESDKTIARGLKEEIVKSEPELAKLNANDSALINLEQVLERAVNRIRNYDVIRWGDTFMTLTGAVVGGPGGAAAGYATKRLLEDAAVKSRIAFALSKAKRIKGLPTTSRVAAFETGKQVSEED